jgi:hypothetical protein
MLTTEALHSKLCALPKAGGSIELSALEAVHDEVYTLDPLSVWTISINSKVVYLGQFLISHR